MLHVIVTILMAWSPLYGISKATFKNTKHKFSLGPFVQIHHIIPRQFKKHPVISGFNIEDGSNYMFMPNALGKQSISTRRPNHQGGHNAYNKYVASRLENIYRNSEDYEYVEQVQSLAKYLRTQIMNGCEDIPWK